MKVLYFHQHFSTPRGAAGLRSYQMAKKLVERGHSVTMVCGSYGVGETGLTGPFRFSRREGLVDGIRVIEIKLPYSNALGFMGRIWTFLRFAFRSMWIALSEDHDLVFATSTPLTAALPGIVSRWVRRKPFVFEVRDLWPELPKAMGVIRNPIILWAMSMLERMAYRSATKLVALSPGMVDGILSCGVAADKVKMIPNGCDLELFSEDVVPWRPSDIPEGVFLAIYPGTHGLANGLEAILDAASVLKSHHRGDIVFLLVGEGSAKAKLQARARRERLTNVIFQGSVPKHKLARLLASADVGLQVLANVPAFYYGTSPNKFFDYLASGLPVICNYPGWVSDLVVSEQCGITVPAEDPVSFAEALEEMAERPEETEQRGAHARQLAEERFSWKDLSDEFSEWLEEAVYRV